MCINVYIHIILMILSMKPSFQNKPLHCSYIYDNSFEHCSTTNNTSSNVKRYLQQMNGENKSSLPSHLSNEKCIGVCRKIFNITQIHGRSFTGQSYSRISDMITHCCGKCGRFIMGELTTELAHTNMSDLDNSDIVFPVLGRSSQHELYNHHYIAMFSVPGAYYLTAEVTEEEMAFK